MWTEVEGKQQHAELIAGNNNNTNNCDFYSIVGINLLITAQG
jgi:hypothetical protein